MEIELFRRRFISKNNRQVDNLFIQTLVIRHIITSERGEDKETGT